MLPYCYAVKELIALAPDITWTGIGNVLINLQQLLFANWKTLQRQFSVLTYRRESGLTYAVILLVCMLISVATLQCKISIWCRLWHPRGRSFPRATDVSGCFYLKNRNFGVQPQLKILPQILDSNHLKNKDDVWISFSLRWVSLHRG